MSTFLNGIIEKELEVLLGTSIKRIRRASDMAILDFGPNVTTTNYKGNQVATSQYALHIQTSFRITNSRKIVLGSSDIYYPKFTEKRVEDFQWDTYGTNLYDERAELLNDDFKANIVSVQALSASIFGDLQITLSNELVINIFVQTASGREEWRFFETHNNKRHFVITGQGLET